MGYKKMYGDTIEFDQVNKYVNIPSASSFKIAGTSLTPTAAELNVLHSSGVTNADLVKLHAVGSTAAEIDIACDASAQTETIAAAGAVSVTKRITKVALTGAGAITIAAPDAAMLGLVKILEMTADNGDVTMALTNVNGGSASTTCTFNDVGDALILVGGVSKWHVIKEIGVTMS